jgi:hypothetical protein
LETFESRKELARPILANESYNRYELEAEALRLIQERQEVEYDSWEREPQVNARSGLFEELTAKGHLSVIESEEPIEETNQRTLQRLINGWSDNLPEWEKERRLSEIVEELINHRVSAEIQAGILPPDAKVFTISNFPSGVPERAATTLGYGVLNDKGMVRSTGFENGIRTVEQVSRSNSNDGSAEQFFAANGFVVGRGPSRLLSNQIIATKDQFPNGVVDLQRALDMFAGPNIIYGEDRRQTNLNVPEYEDLRVVSAAREQQAKTQINKLADFERQLNLRYQAKAISYEEKLRAINKRRKELVDEICILDPSYAKDARGEAAVAHFEMASLAMAAGHDTDGLRHLENALAVADPRAGAVCGGSGVESQTKSTDNLSADAKRLYLEAKEDRNKWKWSKGLCVVKECPSRPAKTEVGPCNVCRNCQKIFDNGNTPKSVYKTLGFIDMLTESVRQFNQKYDAEQQQKKAIQAARAKAEAIRQAQLEELQQKA